MNNKYKRIKEGEALRVLSCGAGTLGKKFYKWNVPADLQSLAKKYDCTFIGISRWNSPDREYYWCIATPKDIIYLNLNSDAVAMIRRYVG